MSKTNKPYKCMYCGERYSTLSHVSICPCDKFSNIPPSENTDNKTVATGDQVGVVDSVGDALSHEFDISKKIDESLFKSCPFGSECTIPKTGSCTCENLGAE